MASDGGRTYEYECVGGPYDGVWLSYDAQHGPLDNGNRVTLPFAGEPPRVGVYRYADGALVWQGEREHADNPQA